MSPSSQHQMSIDTLHAGRQSSLPLDMSTARPNRKWINDDYYRTAVLCLFQHTTEIEVDDQLNRDAHDLGMLPVKNATDVPPIPPSISDTTIASEPSDTLAAGSYSVEPTSSLDGDHRPVTSSSRYSENMITSPEPPSILVDIEKKRNSGFCNGIRRIAGFSRKRKSPTASSPTLSHEEDQSHTDADSTRSATRELPKNLDLDLIHTTTILDDPKSPSIRSNKSSSLWSNKISTTTKSSYDSADTVPDHDALQRSMECVELIALRDKQMGERERFLRYQAELLDLIHLERDQIKESKRKLHAENMEDQIRKNDQAVDKLESRQLEEELKMQQDHEHEKRSILTRLRHMEAYCQNPSPPPTPREFTFPSESVSPPTSPALRSVQSMTNISILPERKVTDKDYHNLASCYRERDAMDNLQASKINVLRGKQKRAVENFVLKKDKEVEQLQALQAKEIDEVDREFGEKEAECRAEFWEKRQLLERRWRIQATIEKTRMEKRTGLAYETLLVQILSDKEVEGGLVAAG